MGTRVGSSGRYEPEGVVVGEQRRGVGVPAEPVGGAGERGRRRRRRRGVVEEEGDPVAGDGGGEDRRRGGPGEGDGAGEVAQGEVDEGEVVGVFQDPQGGLDLGQLGGELGRDLG